MDTNDFALDLGIKLKPIKKIEKQASDMSAITAPKIVLADAISAKSHGLVPEARIGDSFNTQVLKERINAFYGNKKLDIKNIDEYEKLMCSILTSIEFNNPLPCSYLIGAPRGLGKTTLANTCIKHLHKQGKRVVPYTSLLDIYALRLAQAKQTYHDDRYTNLMETPELASDLINDYTLTDFLNCDVLFTHLICPEFRVEEISILKLLLMHRGKLGLPTVVFLNMPLKFYLMQKDDKRYFWDEFVAYTDLDNPGYTTLNYKYCFKNM